MLGGAVLKVEAPHDDHGEGGAQCDDDGQGGGHHDGEPNGGWHQETEEAANNSCSAPTLLCLWISLTYL